MTNEVDEVIETEIRDLMERGFECAWIGDVEVGDIFAGPRMFPHDPARKLFVCERLQKTNSSYIGEDDEYTQNIVVHMIVTDEDGLQRELSYGNTWDVYIWRGEA